ncbi:MAG: NifB/NifX family molybdenum-iron cluster-binding protein [Pseudomonadota bacterium]|nr:NifB/NifX family molybdenum-iron cluster-binding protein [Pseudomonadota bacterium]
MIIAIAAIDPDLNAQVALHGARAPYYLLFDDQGILLDSLVNPFVQVDQGAAPRAALFLSDNGVTLLAAGDFGPRLISELEQRGIRYVQKTDLVSDALKELIS